jgi:hypothetical protein
MHTLLTWLIACTRPDAADSQALFIINGCVTLAASAVCSRLHGWHDLNLIEGNSLAAPPRSDVERKEDEQRDEEGHHHHG